MNERKDMVDNGLVTVIVPVYNVECYLDKCISSIVQQSYNNLEIIVVDDGSTDGSPAICDGWAARERRIRVIHKENGGLSDARNAGLAVATGEYISFVDSDDWIKPQFIETLLVSLQAGKADIAECGVVYVDEQEHILRERCYPEKKAVKSKIEALKSLIKEEGIYQTVWNKLYKRDVLEGILFEKGKCNEDDFWTYQVFDRAERLIVTSDKLYCYLQRESSIMGTGYQIKRLDGLKARFERMEYLQKYKELADFTKARIFYDCMFHFQAALKWLKMPEQKIVTDYVIENIKKITDVTYRNSDVPLKYQIWFAMFRRFPFAVAKIRNWIGIGL